MSRRNPVLNPLAVQTAAATATGFGQYSTGTGETGTTTLVAGASDGPLLSSGSRIASYIRRLVTAAKTAGSTGWGALQPAHRAPSGGVAGDRRRAAVWLRYTSPDGSALSGNMRAGVYTSGGVAGAYVDSPLITLPSGQWVLVESTTTASAGFSSVGWWFFQTSARIAIAGSTLDATGAIVGDGEPFAGSLPATTDWTYSWEGAANASASLELPTPGLRVEAFTDAPVPRVGITLTGLDSAGPSRVTLFRSTPGGQRRVVRGWNHRQVYGSDYAIDYEAPLGRPVTYSLEVHSGGVVPLRVSDVATLEGTTGFIQDPLLPLGAVPVSADLNLDQNAVLTSSAFRKLQYAVESSTVKVLGSREPVALTGQRMAAAGVDFSVLTEAAEQSTQLRDLLTETALVLIRPLPSWGPLPDLIYTVPSVSEEPVYGDDGPTITVWALAGDVVRPPSINVLVALWTYDQVAALWSTYNQAQAAATAVAARYLDVQRDPTMGV